MKKIFILALALSAALLITSCGSEKSGENTKTEGTSSKADSKNWQSCFEAYNYDLDKILTKDEALKYIDASNHAQVKTEFDKMESSMGTVSYSYKNGRTVRFTTKFSSQDLPDRDVISFKGLKFSKIDEAKTLELFDRKYKKMSDAEFYEYKSNMEKQFAGKPEELKNAIQLLEVRRGFNTTPVEGLGTAAYWKNLIKNEIDYGVELFVLAGNVEFTVQVKIATDNEVNSKTAIAVAKGILEQCK